MTTSYSIHFKLPIPDFLSEPWHQEIQDMIQDVDNILYDALLAQDVSVWTFSTHYPQGSLVIDVATGGMWVASLENTSSAVGVVADFAAERIAHPSYWNSIIPTVIDPFIVNSLQVLGHTGIGIAPIATVGLYVASTVTGGSNAAGMQLSAQFTPVTSVTINGLVVQPTLQGGAATITNMNGAFIQSPQVGVGNTVHNLTTLRVQAPSGSGDTANRGLVVEGGQSDFGGIINGQAGIVALGSVGYFLDALKFARIVGSDTVLYAPDGSTAAILSPTGAFINTLTITSALNMNAHRIQAVANPTSAQDAATKTYVDATTAGKYLLAGRRVHPFFSAAGAFPLRQDIFPEVIMGAGPGQVTMSKTPLELMYDIAGDPGADTVYVATDGDDANSGDSSDSPVTFAYGVQTHLAPIVRFVDGGPYNPIAFDATIHTANQVPKTLVASNPVTIRVNGAGAPLLGGLTWVHDGTFTNCYRAAHGLGSAVPFNRIVRIDVKDSWGFDSAAIQATSATNLNNFGSSQFGWFADSTNIYINFFGLDVSLNLAKFKALYFTSGIAQMSLKGTKMCFVGPFLFDGVGIETRPNGGNPSHLFVMGDLNIGCLRMQYASGPGVFINGGLSYFSGARVHASSGDNFNYSPSTAGSGPAFGIEHNVISTNAGDLATYAPTVTGSYGQVNGWTQNRNASSCEDLANSLRAGCLYADSYGPTIADVSVTNTAYSWIVGCVSQRSLSPGQGIGAFVTGIGGVRTMWVEATKTSEETSAMCLWASGAGCVLKYIPGNCNLNDGTGSTSTDNIATITTYTPTAP